MILNDTLPLIMIFLLGYLIKKMGALKKDDSKIFGKLLINLVVPAVIIKSFSTISLEASLVYLPVSALIVVISLTILGYLFARALRLGGKTRGAFITAFPTLEGGTMGYAFMLSAFGELGLSRIVLFDFANGIFLFTVVYFISCYFGGGGVRLRDSVAKLFKTPIIWAILLGIFLNAIGFENALVSNLLGNISGSMLLIVMLMLGLEFQPKISSFKLPSMTIFLKTSSGLLLGWIVSGWVGMSGVERIAVIVGASLPPSILTLVFSEENRLDTEFTANLLSIALPFALVFLMVLLNFL